MNSEYGLRRKIHDKRNISCPVMSSDLVERASIPSTNVENVYAIFDSNRTLQYNFQIAIITSFVSFNDFFLGLVVTTLVVFSFGFIHWFFTLSTNQY